MENLFKKFQYCSKFKALKLEKHHFHTKPPYKKTNTAWKVFKYEVISGSYFPVFGLNTGKYRPEITPYLDTFHAVNVKTNRMVSSKWTYHKERNFTSN